jgi:kynureninase
MDELLKWREEFPILGTSTYLISNSLGAMPRKVYDQMHSYAHIWATQGVRAWQDPWWDMAVKVGDGIASLIGAGPGEISLHQNVTLANAIVASCFDFSKPRNKVVMVDVDFPSIIYFYLEQRRYGANVEIIPSRDGLHVPTEEFLRAIDRKTLLVPISQVLFRSATIVDAKAIIQRAHKMGAHVVLDLFQAAGTVPVDVGKLGVDFATGGVLKWLCGGPGVGYLYVRPDLRKKLKPAITGWMAHQRPFGFEVGPVDRRDDAYRFLNGTPHIPALYACQPGLEILNKVSVEAIRAKSMRQTARLVEGVLAHGWALNTPTDAAERAGTVSVGCPNPQEVATELLARNVMVDYRPKAGVRLSPHFYNRDEEIDFALEQIADIVETKPWERRQKASAKRSGAKKRA